MSFWVNLQFGSIIAYLVQGTTIGTAFGIMAACCNLSILLVTTLLFWIKSLCEGDDETGNFHICIFLFGLSVMGLISAFGTNIIVNRDHNGHLNWYDIDKIVEYLI